MIVLIIKLMRILLYYNIIQCWYYWSIQLLYLLLIVENSFGLTSNRPAQNSGAASWHHDSNATAYLGNILRKSFSVFSFSESNCCVRSWTRPSRFWVYLTIRSNMFSNILEPLSIENKVIYTCNSLGSRRQIWKQQYKCWNLTKSLLIGEHMAWWVIALSYWLGSVYCCFAM